MARLRKRLEEVFAKCPMPFIARWPFAGPAYKSCQMASVFLLPKVEIKLGALNAHSFFFGDCFASPYLVSLRVT